MMPFVVPLHLSCIVSVHPCSHMRCYNLVKALGLRVRRTCCILQPMTISEAVLLVPCLAPPCPSISPHPPSLPSLWSSCAGKASLFTLSSSNAVVQLVSRGGPRILQSQVSLTMLPSAPVYPCWRRTVNSNRCHICDAVLLGHMSNR